MMNTRRLSRRMLPQWHHTKPSSVMVVGGKDNQVYGCYTCSYRLGPLGCLDKSVASADEISRSQKKSKPGSSKWMVSGEDTIAYQIHPCCEAWKWLY